MIQAVVNKLLAGDTQGLAGSQLTLDIPVEEGFINNLFALRPVSPLERLAVEALANDQLFLHLAANLPALGRQERKLRLQMRAAYVSGQQEWLHFDILEGLKLLDKPLIAISQSLLSEKIPKGMQLNSKLLSLHLPSLVAQAGKGQLLPFIRQLQLQSEAGKLRLLLEVSL